MNGRNRVLLVKMSETGNTFRLGTCSFCIVESHVLEFGFNIVDYVKRLRVPVDRDICTDHRWPF
jgi:hypothetical protein